MTFIWACGVHNYKKIRAAANYGINFPHTDCRDVCSTLFVLSLVAMAVPAASPCGRNHMRALDPEEVSAFFAKVLEKSSEPALQEEARKLQKKQQQYSFSVPSTLDTTGLRSIVPLVLPDAPAPPRKPSPWVKEAVARVRRYWHISSSQNTTRALIDVILLETMEQLPEDKKLKVWGEAAD